MGGGIDFETLRVSFDFVVLFTGVYILLRPFVLEKVRASKERARRLDGRKDAE